MNTNNINAKFLACGLFVVVVALCACKGTGEGELNDYSILQLPPPVITIESQPTPITNFIEGDVSGSLSVGATATRKGELNYQWYSAAVNSNADGAEITGATDESFDIPKDLLAAGSPYYYFCEVRAIGVKGSVSDATPVRSNVAAVNVAPLPVITIDEQPAETTDVAAGSIAGSLTVNASVTEGATLSYQWYSATTKSNAGGSVIAGATAASFSIPTTLTVAGSPYYYFCELSATGGAVSVRSDVATVNVKPAGTPIITIETQPEKTVDVTAGSISGSLSVTASVSEGATLSYQWFSNTTDSNTSGLEIAGATLPTLDINKSLTAAGSPYYYFCELRATGGAATVRTDVTTVNVKSSGAPIINIETQPAKTTNVTAGNISGSLSVTASVTEGAILSYQWYRNTTESNAGGTETEVAGAMLATFIIPTTLTVDGSPYYYFCEVRATGGAASVRSDVATVNVSEKGTPIISIDAQPTKTTNVTEGSITGSLSVGASVTEGATLSYQWYSNTTDSNTSGFEIAGATMTIFDIPKTLTVAVSPCYYFCEVRATGGAASVRSNVATVNVSEKGTPIISIDDQPAKTTNVTAGSISGNLTVGASVTEGATLNYQWYSNTIDSNAGGVKIGSATSASFEIPKTLTVLGSPYYYFCELSATGAETRRSDVATVTVTAQCILPAVSTDNVTNFTGTTAYICGNITNAGTPAYSERGVVYATTHNPTVDGSKKTVAGASTGIFCADVEGLSANRTYYARAYATNTCDTAYGEEVEFTTTGTPPAVTTKEATLINTTYATLGGTIISAGAPIYTKRGVFYGTAPNPAYTGGTEWAIGGSGTGDFSDVVTNLTIFTKYYVQAFATNTEGTAYGEPIEFTTLDIPPVFTMNPITGITESAATVSVSVSNGGTPAYTDCGVAYATTENPTINDNKKTLSTIGAANTFTGDLTGLTPGTLYYARPYATNAADTRYGAQATFTAKKVTVGGQTGTLTAGVAGTVTFAVTTAGIANGSYTAMVANLPTDVSVQGQVNISNNAGTLTLSGTTSTTVGTYSNLTLTFDGALSAAFTLTVSAPVSPALTTNAPTNVTYESATLGGNITNAGTPAYTERGVVYATTQTPTTANSKKIISGSGTGNFSDEVTGLTAYIKYYVRAYVITPLGTIYGEEVTVTPFSIEMVSVTGGTFTMGSPEGTPNSYSDERPTHQVTLSGYNIGKYLVTQGQWLAVMGSWPGSSPSSSNGVGNDYPAYYVSWNDIVGTDASEEGYNINGISYYKNGFCYKLSQLAGGGKQYRLPTEAEWEFAARGGIKGKGYPFDGTNGPVNTYSGSDEIDDVAWYSGNNSPNGTKPVGGKLPNELGIYDMSGNVYEWCGDWYASYSSNAQTDPTGPTSGSSRVNRGGNWISNAGNCRVALRSSLSPDNRNDFIGIRLVLP